LDRGIDPEPESCQTCPNGRGESGCECARDPRIATAEIFGIVTEKVLAKARKEAVQEAMEQEYQGERGRQSNAALLPKHRLFHSPLTC
jgi:hypothetical protein